MTAGHAFRRGLIMLAVVVSAFCCRARAQEDGGVDYTVHGEELLESVFVPFLPNAPFSVMLDTEWVRFLKDGGSFTRVNRRPIKRDSAGRIYEERWLLAPKGRESSSRLSWIQIFDPVAGVFYECTPRLMICELQTLHEDVKRRFNPEAFKSGTLGRDRGTRTHEDLGMGNFAGVRVHEFRDTLTLNPGAEGNDKTMAVVRHFRFSPELGFNLSSVLETPNVGRQTFTVTDISTTEPDAHFFAVPEGYRVVDKRDGAGAK